MKVLIQTEELYCIPSRRSLTVLYNTAVVTKLVFYVKWLSPVGVYTNCTGQL